MIDQLFGHAASTNDFTVRASSSYLPEQSRVNDRRWFWSYHIRIENHSDAPARLVLRHLRITDASGRVALVDGEGVVGEQPRLEPGQSHDYVSGCPLETAHGAMEGHYTFQHDDGTRFDVAIPHFPLEAPATAG